jgi:hypothetical protein
MVRQLFRRRERECRASEPAVGLASVLVVGCDPGAHRLFLVPGRGSQLDALDARKPVSPSGRMGWLTIVLTEGPARSDEDRRPAVGAVIMVP